MTYFYDDSKIYAPTSSNVNIYLKPVETGYHNDCPSHFGNEDEEDITTKKSQINTKEDELATTTDGGDTEGTNEDIEGANSDEALKLRNSLLEKSPTLSDTVMVNATMQENVLPKIMLKEVLAENPQAAKSDKVRDALNSRINLLPLYMRDEIDEGKNSVSEKEILEMEIAHLKKEYRMLFNNKVQSFMNDTTEASADSLENLLINDETLQSKYHLYSFYVNKEDVTQARNVFNSINSYFNLSAKELQEYNLLSQFVDIQLNLMTNNKTWFEVSDEQRSTLETLAEDAHSSAGLKAQGVLELISSAEFEVVFPEEDGGNKNRYSTEEDLKETFEVYPKITKDYFIIEYVLGEKENAKDVKISIFNEKGKEIKDFEIRTSANQFLIECENWEAGAYWVRKFVNKKIINEEKIIIKQANSQMDESDIKSAKINVREFYKKFDIYPNPAKDYFFVKYNLKDEQINDISLQISDNKGVVIRNIDIDKNTNQLKISTNTLKKGSYTVSLVGNKKLIKAIKIIIE